jgi:pantetheine-phosphate adenylyltransferase
MNHSAQMTVARASALAARLAEIIPTRYLASESLLGELAHRWCERQRFWHGPGHLLALLEEIVATTRGEDRDVLLLTALYHDAIYNPRATDNETASAQLLLAHAADVQAPVLLKAAELIEASNWAALPESSLGRFFFDLDTRQLSDGCSLAARLAYERAIFQECQWVSWALYRSKRAEFLALWAERFPLHRRGIAESLELLAGLAPRIAVYPGSFQPFHLGHLSILRQAELSFDKVILGVGVNRQKLGASDSLAQRHAGLQGQLAFHEVAVFPGLLSDFLQQQPLPATVVRGVRDGTDLEAELRVARFLNELRPGSPVVWISCEPELQHLSSSAIRELGSIEPGTERRYLPDTASIYQLSP